MAAGRPQAPAPSTTTSASRSHLAGIADAALCWACTSIPETAFAPASAAAPTPAPPTKSRRLIVFLRFLLRSMSRRLVPSVGPSVNRFRAGFVLTGSPAFRCLECSLGTGDAF